MKLIQMIQYCERFASKELAEACLYSLANLDGFSCGRCIESPKTQRNDENWLCQAFFEYSKGIDPDAIESCEGMRLVSAPLSLLLTMRNS